MKSWAASSEHSRTSIACPENFISSCLRPSGSPAATRNCNSTRSSPVIASVTGCSTCRRGFISLKKNSPAFFSKDSSVPAPSYPIALSTAAGDGLDHDGKADLFRLSQHGAIALVRTLVTGDTRHTGGLHDRLRAGLVAHRLDGLRRWPDEHQAGVAAGLPKILVFRQKAIAGVNGVGAAGLRRGNDRLDPQIRLRRQRPADADGLVVGPHIQRLAVHIRIDFVDSNPKPARGTRYS